MKIKLAVISSLYGGGVEAVNTTLVENFDDNNISSTFITLVQNKSDILKHDYSYNVEYIFGTSTKKCIVKYIRKLKKIAPDIILTCKFDDVHIALIYKFLFNHKVKIVYVQHSVFSTVKGLSFKAKFNNIFLPRLTRLNKRLDALIFVSRGVEEDYKKNFKSIVARNLVIYNPITSSRSNFSVHKINRHKIKLVTAGRLSPEKDQFTIIDAVSKLNKLKLNTTLDIFGNGDLKEKLLKYSQKIEIQNKIHFKGFSSNLINDIKSYDIFVLSSLYESFGNVIVEAMNSCLPVISSDCEVGPRDILSNGKFGILVPVRNSDAIVDAVFKYINMDLHDLQFNAYNRSLDFSIEKSVQAYTDLFNQLINK